MIKGYNLDPVLRERIQGLPRRQIHVCKAVAPNADYLYDAIPHGHLFHTILEAVAVAQAYDDIIVWPGQYKETATIALKYDSMKLLAAEMGPFGRCLTRTEIRQYGHVDTPCMSIETGHNIEVAGFRITPYDPGTLSTAINLGQTAATYGAYIHHNYFYGVASGATGPCFVRMGTVDTLDADSAFIYRNDFYCGGASNDSVGQIEWLSAGRAQIRENNFWTQGNVATAFAINIDNANGMRGGIFDNRFMNIEIGLTGSRAVAINNPAYAGGDILIDGNHFINYSTTAQCIANLANTGVGVNYLNEHIIAGG